MEKLVGAYNYFEKTWGSYSNSHITKRTAAASPSILHSIARLIAAALPSREPVLVHFPKPFPRKCQSSGFLQPHLDQD